MTPLRTALQRTLVPLLLASLLAAQGEGRLRLGTWNLEFFGGPASMRSFTEPGKERREVPPRDETDVQRIGQTLKELDVRVLAVQEIGGEEALAGLAAATGPNWRSLLGTSGGWNDGKAMQGIGFVWDSERVELLYAEELNAFPREQDGVPIFHRVPVTACFRDKRTGLDFRAVVVHLKAGRAADDKKKRRLEATILRDWIVTLQSSKNEDQDVVVLGDFNSTYGDDPQVVFEESGALRYLPQTKPEPTILHFPEPIDQMAFSPRFLEVVPHTFDAHGEMAAADRDGYRKTFSDHFLVTVDLVAAKDDDPEAMFSRGAPEQVLPASRRMRAEAAPAANAPKAEARFARGQRVMVFLLNGENSEGTLLTPLGEWVELLEGKTPRAFPREQVREVRAL